LISAATDTAGQRFYVGTTLGGSSAVQVIDVSSRTTVDSIAVTPGAQIPVALAVDAAAGRLYVSETSGLDVKVFDLTTHALLGSITGLSNSEGIAVDPVAYKLYVATNNTIRVYDSITLALLTAFGSVPDNDWYNPNALALDRTNGRLYAGSQTLGETDVFDTATGTLLATLQFYSRAYAVDPAQGKLFAVANVQCVAYSTLTYTFVALLGPCNTSAFASP
jgi:DNA-binding beta-propeller fold protein YncE